MNIDLLVNLNGQITADRSHLFRKVLHNRVFRNLGPDDEPPLDLLLDPIQHLVIRLGSESFDAGKVPGHGGIEGRNLAGKSSSLSLGLLTYRRQ